MVWFGGPERSVTPHLWAPVKPAIRSEHTHGYLFFEASTSEKAVTVPEPGPTIFATDGTELEK